MINIDLTIDDGLTHDAALVRALNSITSNQVDAIIGIARASGQEWDVQAADDYDGYRFVLIETAGHGDEQKSFFVAGTAQRLELFETKDESPALIETFSTMAGLKSQLTRLVESK